MGKKLTDHIWVCTSSAVQLKIAPLMAILPDR